MMKMCRFRLLSSLLLLLACLLNQSLICVHAAVGDAPSKATVPEEGWPIITRAVVLQEPIEVQTTLAQMLRVDHAGEKAAVQIYRGQMWALGEASSVRGELMHMLSQEQGHYDGFEALMDTYGASRSIATYVDAVPFAWGAVSALFGVEGAMLCTVAVEENIIMHYNEQIAVLEQPEFAKYGALRDMLVRNRDEENEHRVVGVDHAAYSGPLFVRWLAETLCYVGLLVAKRI
jgi:ubiquinone biosynthesis monooxygenase Coq7